MNKKMLIAIKITAIVVIVALLPVVGWYIYGHTSITASIPTVSWNASDILDLNNVRNYDMGEEFKILQLTDTHFHGIVLNLKTRNSITAMIENTKPDLIVVTGDVCTSDANGVIYEKYIDFMDSFKIPYATVFGNHDAEGRADKNKLASILMKGKYSVFETGPTDLYGLGNYVINVKNGDNVAWSLFLMDSNMYYEDGYDYIHSEQINWYTWYVNNLKAVNGDALNSLMFFHIPLIEYGEAWSLKDSDEVTYYYGDKREEECPSDINSGFFDTICSLDSTRGIFVGHDHINDYSIEYQGVRLTYGLKTGYGSYNNDGLRGGTLITLSESDFTVSQIFQD